MTKIDQLHPGQVGQPQLSPKSDTKARGEFAALLDEALELQGEGPAKLSHPPPTFPQLNDVAPTLRTEAAAPSQALTPLQKEGVERAERAINLLEEYAERLGQPQTSLKELQPSLAALEQEAKGLAEVADRLDPDDQLHGIVQEVLMRVAAESVKFNRGDYLTAT
jgi:hypothetical protein